MPTSNPRSLSCPTCGAPLETDGTKPVVHCKFCQNVILIDALKPGEKPEAAPEKARGVPEEILAQINGNNLVEATRLYREIYDVSQIRARYAIEQIRTGNLLAPEAGFAIRAEPTVEVTPLQKAGVATIFGGFSLLGCVIPIFVLLIVGGVFLFAFMQPGSPINPKLNPLGPAVLMPAEQDDPPDVVTQFYNVNDEVRLLGRVSTSTGKIIWKSEPLPKDQTVNALRADSTAIYYVNDNHLTALNSQDGSQIWQVELPDKLEYGEDSVVVLNGLIFAISQDRTLQVYNTLTGEQTWSRSLTGNERRIRVMGSRIVIMEPILENNNTSLIFLEPSNGEESLVITPICQAENSLEDDITLEGGIVYDEAENSLTLIYGFFDGCVQRYNLQNGQLSWQYTQDDAFNFSMDDFRPILTESRLIFNYNHSLYSINEQSGVVQLIIDDPDYKLVPLQVSGDNLLVRAQRTRGSERFELWGINVVNGTRLWQITLENSDPLDPPNAYQSLLDSDDFAWTWHETAGGVMLLNFQGEPHQLVIKTIHLADGSSFDEKIIPLKSISSDFYSAPEIIGWQGNLLYFTTDAKLFVLDASTGEIIMEY